MKNEKIALLIPCYNESLTIDKVVRDYRKVLPEADIYVYDNNSSDNTDTIARNAGAIVRYEYRQGKGNVIRSMFRDIEADCYLMIDGDDTYPPENAREMCDLVLSGKLIMALCFLGPSVISDTFNYITQYQLKMEVASNAISPLAAIKANLSAFWMDPLKLILIICFIYFLYMTIKKHLHFDKTTCIVLLGIGIIPFIWYSIVPKHSYIHIFFTYRELAVTTFALACAAVSAIQAPPQK